MRLRLLSCLAPVLCAAPFVLGAGCGDGDGGLVPDGGGGASGNDGGGADVDQTPKPVPGGGTGGGPVAGKVTVFVLDEANDMPIAGAYVQIGETMAAMKNTLTDAMGVATFSDAGLTGPQTVTAGKASYRTDTVVGVDAASITISLHSRKAAAVDTGKLRGTVDFTGLPSLPFGQFRAAFVSYDLYDDLLGGARNNIMQGKTGNIDDNAYIPDPPVNKKEWILVAPVGAVDLFAIVATIDTHLSTMATDWTFTVTHLGILDGLTVAKGDDKMVGMIPISAPLDKTLKINVPDLPTGMKNRSAIVLLRNGANKMIPIVAPGVDYTLGVAVPSLAGSFASGSFWVVATTDDDDGKTTTKTAVSILRDITDTSVAAAPAAFVGVIGAPAWSLSEIYYTPVPEASLHGFAIQPRGDTEVWNVAVVDKTRTKIHMPEIPSGAPLETIPNGDLTVSGGVFVVPGFDPGHAVFRDLSKQVSRLSSVIFTGKK